MFKKDDNDVVGTAILDLVDALAEQCTAINLFGKTATKNTIQSLWEMSVANPSIDRIIGTDDGWSLFTSTLVDGVDADLISIFNKIIIYVNTEVTPLRDIVDRLTKYNYLHYGLDDVGKNALANIRDVYADNPHLIVIKLFELLSASQLASMGIGPIIKRTK